MENKTGDKRNEDLNNIVSQRDLTDEHRTLYPTTAHSLVHVGIF